MFLLKKKKQSRTDAGFREEKVDDLDSQARHGRVEPRTVPLIKEEIEATYSQVQISICFGKMEYDDVWTASA